ncbi:LOW QUALITY PROTEIN: cadherin-like protein 26 [Erethizon dorsatum]
MPVHEGENCKPLWRFKRRWVISMELEEEDPGPLSKFVGELFNNMADSVSLMYLIGGPGVDECLTGLFSIEDLRVEKIYVHHPVDETAPSFMVCFDVEDCSTGKIMDESLIFIIRISDVNDHEPFPEKEFNIRLKENQTVGQPIFQMLSADVDPENTPISNVLYFLISQTPLMKESGFWIDRISGEILSGCLDYEATPRFTLLSRAMGCGEPPLSFTATVHIDVQEANNHMPTFARTGEGPWKHQNTRVSSTAQPLDCDTHAARSLVIAVEKEQLSSCKGHSLQQPRRAAASATVRVQGVDTNDAPAFHPQGYFSREDGSRPRIQPGTFSAMEPDRIPSLISTRLENYDFKEEDLLQYSSLPPETGTAMLMLFLSDISDNEPALSLLPCYLAVSFVGQPFLLGAEDQGVEPYSDPLTFELDNTAKAEDTWKLGKNLASAVLAGQWSMGLSWELDSSPQTTVQIHKGGRRMTPGLVDAFGNDLQVG